MSRVEGHGTFKAELPAAPSATVHLTIEERPGGGHDAVEW